MPLLERVTRNPFYVLECEPKAPRAELERAGQRLLALLAVGGEAARRYAAPLGAFERDDELVRQSVARLRDPRERLLWELWVLDKPWPEPARQSAGCELAARVWGWPKAWRSR